MLIVVQGDLLVVVGAVHIQEKAIFIADNFPWVVPRGLLGTDDC